MRAVIYARYSSDNQREESTEGQIRECTEYAEYNDIEIVGQYIDRAFSAKTDDRPDFLRMVNDSSKRLFDIVLVCGSWIVLPAIGMTARSIVTASEKTAFRSCP